LKLGAVFPSEITVITAAAPPYVGSDNVCTAIDEATRPAFVKVLADKQATQPLHTRGYGRQQRARDKPPPTNGEDGRFDLAIDRRAV
jgi:hypothetical protein